VTSTLLSGPNISVPWDFPIDTNNNEFVNLNSVAPTVGDTYQFQATFSDASTQTLPATVTDVLTSFVTGMTAQTTTPGPQLHWYSLGSPRGARRRPTPIPRDSSASAAGRT
jgi:hypothetical protein